MSVRPRVPAVARERMAVGTFAKDCTRMISPKPAQGGLDSGAVVGDEHALPFRRRAAVLRPHALVRFCGGGGLRDGRPYPGTACRPARKCRL